MKTLSAIGSIRPPSTVRAVLARQIAVDEIGAAEERGEDERGVLAAGALVEEPAGERDQRQPHEVT